MRYTAVLYACLAAIAFAGKYGRQPGNVFDHYEPTLLLNSHPDLVVHQLPEMDAMEELRKAEEEFARTMEKVFIAGKINNVTKDFFSVAGKAPQDNGVLYTAAWRVDDALSLAIHFDKFILPEGGAMWIIGDYSKLGPFTHETRWTNNNFMTTHVEGEQVTVAYFQKTGTVGTPVIHVDVVTGRWRDGDGMGGSRKGGARKLLQRAGACNIQAICVEDQNQCSGCDPRDRSCSIQCTRYNGDNILDQWAGNHGQSGEYWGDEEQHGVVVMASGSGSRFCSGSFINNIGGQAIVLTAAHCSVGGSDLIHKYWRTETCTSSSNTDGDHVVSGDLNVIVNNAESDATLVEIRGLVIGDRELYLAGWEAGDLEDPAPEVVGIHHPSGSNMKISHGMEVTTTRWSGQGAPTHWRISEWTEATTEPGSSGSPLYNQRTKRLIGQLHGGTAACPAYNGWDSYGGIYRSYATSAGFRNALNPNALGMDGAFLQKTK